MKKNAIYGLLTFLLVFCFIGCDNGSGNGNGDENGNGNGSGNEKTIVGNWTKTDGDNIGILKINSDNTWSLTNNGDPLVSDGTWDVGGMTFEYNYNSQITYITVTYTLSPNKNQLTLSGEDVHLIGGSSPWTRVE